MDNAGGGVGINRYGSALVVVVDANGDGEVKGYYGIAAVNGLEGLGVGAGFAIINTIPGVARVGTSDSNACVVAWTCTRFQQIGGIRPSSPVIRQCAAWNNNPEIVWNICEKITCTSV